MKKYLIFLIVFFLKLNAQNHFFVYELKFKEDTLSADFTNAPQVLLISNNETKFFDYKLYKQDSINKNSINGVRTSINSKANLETKRKLQTQKNDNYRVISLDYYVYESKDKFSWELSKEIKNINHYSLQKAITRFGGREWTAWFCKDIPISEGPYKFNGLPGLIFEIYDENENYHFTLIEERKIKSNIDTNSFLENSYSRKAIKVDFNILKDIMLKFYQDPLFSFRQEAMKNNRGVNYTKEQENEIRDYLKRFNNPLEINIALKY